VAGGRLTHEAGSLQEFDHVPVLAPITKSASTVHATAGIPAAVHDALRTALTAHRGPTFLDFPLDVLFAQGEAEVPAWQEPRGVEPDGDEVARAAALIAGAERPALIAGTDVYWDGAWDELAAA
jgi:acetolactate synthase-1/2/3 large subunit